MKRIVIIHSLFITVVVSAIILVCCLMGDAVSLPLQLAGGLTPEQIQESQNSTLLAKHPYAIIFLIIGVFIMSVLMLNYLGHGDTYDDYKRSNERLNRQRNKLIDNL